MLRILIIYGILFLQAVSCYAQVNIWEGESCKAKVKMTPYLVDGCENIAVIICPGGSYYWLDKKNEGQLVGEWLQRNGISAFVLHYRTATGFAFSTGYRYIFRGHRYPDPQDDLRQAIVYLKKNAKEFGISPNSVGVMGFSAGGHLVMSSAELFEEDCKPAFIVPIYPVITLSGECVHKRSRRGLLGDNRCNDTLMQDSLSLEKHVPADCPPVFLVNCVDDPIVKYRNSELLDSALSANNIPHKYIQFGTGGHGFGASDEKGTAESRTWKNEFLIWLYNLNL